MRKFSASLLAISFFMLIFCGCEKVAEPVTPNTTFIALSEMVTDGITMTAEITACGSDDVNITLCSPETLKGLSYHKVNSTLYIEYNGLKCTTADDYLTSYNPFEVVFDVLSSLESAQLKASGKEGELYIYTGKCSYGEYLIYIDEKSSDIQKIVPTFTDCEITFSYE